MNLSEFFLSLMLCSLLLILALHWAERIYFHSLVLEEQLQLEDTTLKALLTLNNEILSSRLSYCTPRGPTYEFKNHILLTHQLSPAYYLELPVETGQHTLALENTHFEEGETLILDDCHHWFQSKIINITSHNHHQSLELEQSLPQNFQPPILIGSLHLHRFYVGRKGLYQTIDDEEYFLRYPQITALHITAHYIRVEGRNETHAIEFQKTY